MEYSISIPNIAGGNDYLRSGTMQLGLGSTPIPYPQQIQSWVDNNGNPVASYKIPDDAQWGTIRIWDPCLSGGIKLNAGLTPGAPSLLYKISPPLTPCPANSFLQFVGQLTVQQVPIANVQPSIVDLEVQ